MSGWIRRGSWLFDPVSGAQVGYVDSNGVEQAMALGALNSAWVGFGDSIVANCGGPNIGSGKNLYDKSWVIWASAQLGGRLKCVRNAGVTGDNTAMMLARLETDVTPYASGVRFCIFNGGVNDYTGGNGSPQTFAQSQANLIAIITRLRQLFPVVVWCSPTPYASTATVAAQASQLARWVRDYAQTIPGVLFVDNYGALVAPTLTTGDMVSTYSDDTPKLHPNSVGARAIASGLATVLTPLLSASAPLPVAQHNTVANAGSAYATQALPNPLLVNNGGTITGTNVVSAGAAGLAGAPSDFTVRAGTSGVYTDGTTSVTCQLVARADGYGNDLQLVQTAGASAGTPIIEVLTADHSAQVSGGQTIQGSFTLSMSGASGVKKIVLYLSIADSSGAQTYTALSNDGATFSQTDFANYVFKTTPYTLVGTVTALRLRADIYGVDKNATATFKLGKMAIDILQAS